MPSATLGKPAPRWLNLSSAMTARYYSVLQHDGVRWCHRWQWRWGGLYEDGSGQQEGASRAMGLWDAGGIQQLHVSERGTAQVSLFSFWKVAVLSWTPWSYDGLSLVCMCMEKYGDMPGILIASEKTLSCYKRIYLSNNTSYYNDQFMLFAVASGRNCNLHWGSLFSVYCTWWVHSWVHLLCFLRAAFQYGLKMADGRKTRRTGPKDDKKELDREWQKIQNIIQKRKQDSHGDDPFAKNAKYD